MLCPNWKVSKLCSTGKSQNFFCSSVYNEIRDIALADYCSKIWSIPSPTPVNNRVNSEQNFLNDLCSVYKSSGHKRMCCGLACTHSSILLTYKTSESADVHHNRRTLVCRKDSCWSESLWGLTHDIDLAKELGRGGGGCVCVCVNT